jgi:hypothetical protein
MTEIEESFKDKTFEQKAITFRQIIRIIILKPLTEIDLILNQEKYKYAHLFPLIYGIITGFSKSLSIFGFANLNDLVYNSVQSILFMLFLSYLFCFIFSWIVTFSSNLLKGISNFNMTYGLVTYASTPIIVGSTTALVLKIFLYATNQSPETINISNFIIYNTQLIFVIWSLFIIVIGNAFINSFSMLRSFISSALLSVLIILISIFRN